MVGVQLFELTQPDSISLPHLRTETVTCSLSLVFEEDNQTVSPPHDVHAIPSESRTCFVLIRWAPLDLHAFPAATKAANGPGR
jgi:hypothetical protein